MVAALGLNAAVVAVIEGTGVILNGGSGWPYPDDVMVIEVPMFVKEVFLGTAD